MLTGHKHQVEVLLEKTCFNSEERTDQTKGKAHSLPDPHSPSFTRQERTRQHANRLY